MPPNAAPRSAQCPACRAGSAMRHKSWSEMQWKEACQAARAVLFRGTMLRCRLRLPDWQAARRRAYRHRSDAVMTVLVEPFASAYDHRSRIGVLTPPSITALGLF